MTASASSVGGLLSVTALSMGTVLRRARLSARMRWCRRLALLWRTRDGLRHRPVAACFCTLAIHAPYRRRARLLCADLAPAPCVVLTDEPDDFADLPVRAIRHAPTGPMAVDYLERLSPVGGGRGAAAYHDKRFALLAALEDFETAIFVDADSRLVALPPLDGFPPGVTVLPDPPQTIAEHLQKEGPWRLPFFEDLARSLVGDAEVLHSARWCDESCYAVTRDGHEHRFFAAWGRAAEFLQGRGVYSGEGGVMGLAAAYAGWTVDDRALAPIARAIRHEAGGPKGA